MKKATSLSEPPCEPPSWFYVAAHPKANLVALEPCYWSHYECKRTFPIVLSIAHTCGWRWCTHARCQSTELNIRLLGLVSRYSTFGHRRYISFLNDTCWTVLIDALFSTCIVCKRNRCTDYTDHVFVRISKLGLLWTRPSVPTDFYLLREQHAEFIVWFDLKATWPECLLVEPLIILAVRLTKQRDRQVVSCACQHTKT